MRRRLVFGCTRISRPNQIPPQRTIKLLHPHRHLHRIEGILHNKIPINLITPPYHDIRIGLLGAAEQQELDAGGGLEAGQAEVAALQRLDAGGGRFAVAGEVGRQRRGVDGAADGVDAVEGAGEDEVIVAVELLQARGEGAVVDEAAGFVDDEEGEDDPGVC